MDWLTLQKDEKIISEFKPALIPWLFAPALSVLLASLFLGFLAGAMSKNLGIGIVGFIAIAVLQLFMAVLSHSHAYYVITNKRLVQKSGLLGYSVKSVSYNRLADVIVRHSFTERILGVGSVLIQTLAGQVSRGSFGAEISFLYLNNPEEVQKKIYQLIGK